MSPPGGPKRASGTATTAARKAARTGSAYASEPRVPGMARTVALALAFLTMLVGEAQATEFRVIAAPGLTFENLDDWEDEAAIGLVVPDAGPETSELRARTALVRGEVRNSLRSGAPGGRALIELLPLGDVSGAPPMIVVGLPQGGEQPNDRRYPVAVFGDGFEGLLVSDSTRIPGLVSIADIAPTALDRDDGLTWQAAGDPSARLVDLDRRISD